MSIRRTNFPLSLLLCVLLSTRVLGGVKAAGPPVRVSPEDEALAHPVWSPDGRWIAATRPNYTGIWLLAPDGSTAKQLLDAPGAGYGMSWAPDGRAILARVSRVRDRRREHALQVVDIASGRAVFLTRWRRHIDDVPLWAGPNKIVLHSQGHLEAWSLKGGDQVETLASSPPGVFYARGGAVYRTGRAKPLFRVDGEGYILNLRPSPNGELVAFEVSGSDLFVVSADGKSVVDLGPGNRPRWSPDSRWLVFFVAKDDGYRYLSSDLYVVRPDGSERTRLTQTDDMLEMDPCWGPDGRHLAFYDYGSSAVYVMELSVK